MDSTRFHFMDSMHLWFNRAAGPEAAGEGTSDNVISLSEAFYQEITAHPIPVEREVIAALAHAPGLLDFYVWIAWKSWTVNCQPTRVPIFGANGLGHQLGTTEYSVDRMFKHKITQWLRHVKLLWPECPAQVSQDGAAAGSPKSAVERFFTTFDSSGSVRFAKVSQSSDAGDPAPRI